MSDLYEIPLDGVKFRRACGGNQQEEEMESCVELAEIREGIYAVRDSKNPNAGTLRFTRAELEAFAKLF